MSQKEYGIVSLEQAVQNSLPDYHPSRPNEEWDELDDALRQSAAELDADAVTDIQLDIDYGRVPDIARDNSGTVEIYASIRLDEEHEFISDLDHFKDGTTDPKVGRSLKETINLGVNRWEQRQLLATVPCLIRTVCAHWESKETDYYYDLDLGGVVVFHPKQELSNLFKKVGRHVSGLGRWSATFETFYRLQLMGSKRRINVLVETRLPVIDADILHAFNLAEKRGWKHVVIRADFWEGEYLEAVNLDQYNHQRAPYMAGSTVRRLPRDE